MAKFEKGRSGNPGGRPKEVAEVRELARQKTTQAVDTLTEIMQDVNAPAAARVSAANALLDRGFGRPQQGVALTGDEENPIALTRVDAPDYIRDKILKMLPSETLDELIAEMDALEAEQTHS